MGNRGLSPKLLLILNVLYFGTTPILSPGGMGESDTCLALSRNDELFLTITVSLPQDFEISWIHSVEKEEWRERFVIDTDRTIRIESTRFRTFGAGVPDNAPETTTQDGWVIMSGLNRQVDPLVLRSNNETDHKLSVANRTYFLPEGQYWFTVRDTCFKR